MSIFYIDFNRMFIIINKFINKFIKLIINIKIIDNLF